MVLPFLDIHSQPRPESDEALTVSCWVPREKHTHIAGSLFPLLRTHQLLGGLQIFLMSKLLAEIPSN